MERFYGIEQEFGTYPVISGGESRRLLDSLGFARLGEFLGNGYRGYMDVGNHFEFATPQEPDIRSVVAAYLGGHIMAQALHGSFVEVMPTTDPLDENGDSIEEAGPKIERLSLESNVIDRLGNAWGLHENYDTSVNQTDSEVIDTLASVQATRPEFGAGRLVFNSEGDIVMRRSQKGHTVTRLVGNGTTINRPLVHLGREAHGGKGRLHAIINDARMIPWNTQVPMGLLAGALTLLENGHDMSDLLLEDPVVASLKVSKDDPESRTVVTRRYGTGEKSITHDEHIQLQAEKILEHSDEVTEEIQLLAEEAYRAMDDKKAAMPMTSEAVMDGHRHPLANKNDSVAKKELLTRMRAKGMDNEKIYITLMTLWGTMDKDKNFVYKARTALGDYSEDPLGSLDLAQDVVDGTHMPHEFARKRTSLINAAGTGPNLQEFVRATTNWERGSYYTLGLFGTGQKHRIQTYY